MSGNIHWRVESVGSSTNHSAPLPLSLISRCVDEQLQANSRPWYVRLLIALGLVSAIR